MVVIPYRAPDITQGMVVIPYRPPDITQGMVVIPYRPPDITQGMVVIPYRPLNMPGRNYRYTLRNFPEECRSNLLCGGILKTRDVTPCRLVNSYQRFEGLYTASVFSVW